MHPKSPLSKAVWKTLD